MVKKRVTIVGAGNVGATAGMLLAFHDVADVCLIDVVEGVPQGKALDMMHMRSVEQFESRVTGTNDYKDTADSDVVVITAGIARKPGMTRDDLLGINAKIMADVIENVMAVSPEAIVVCVTNPLDIMAYLAYKKSGLDKSRIFGMGGVLDSARFTFAVAEKTGADVADITSWAMGAHGDAMTPMPRFTTVKGTPITEILSREEVDELVQRTVFGGAEVVAHLKTGSAFYAPAASIARMVSAIILDTKEIMPCCTYLTGEYGISDVFISVPARLGASGIEEVVEFDFNEAELEALRGSAATVAASLDALGLRG
ncbi:MAG: malate dehydrogenase [Coriobacteriia bacterium]|nr:malate dehydrogenase [Coriobacteriia bacterium]